MKIIERKISKAASINIYIEYLICRADLNLEVDFESNNIINTVATWWDVFFIKIIK